MEVKELEKKVEKHNNLIERMYKAEESVKSAHKRLDGLDKVMRNVPEADRHEHRTYF